MSDTLFYTGHVVVEVIAWVFSYAKPDYVSEIPISLSRTLANPLDSGYTAE